MWAFWIFRSGYKEGQRWARWIADRRPEVPSELHVEGLIGASELLRWGGELDEAADLTRYTLPTLRALEEHALVAALLTSLAEIRSIQGRTDEGRELALEALEIRRRVGDPEGLASTLGALGLVEFYAEDFVAARTLFEEALGVWGKSSLYDVAEIRLRLGMCSARLGDPAGARDHLRAAFALALQQQYVFPEAFEELASVCASTHPDQSAVLLGAAAAIRSQAGTPSRLDERHLSMCRILRTELGEDAFDALWAEGAAMSHDEAADLALSLD
jgi:tetratricopeptide (TPR) repeat protein